MTGRTRFTEEEVKHISYRMKSARALTGLNQEDFAKKYDIAYMSLKCWEIGRAIPRKENLEQYLNAIRNTGIEISTEWVFYGSGPGPTYMNGTQVERRKSGLGYHDTQIELFKKEQLAKGLNPIVVSVDDELMAPEFRIGHIIGAVFTTIAQIKEKFSLYDIIKTPWLIMTAEDKFAPRYLLVNNDKIFFKSNQELDIKPYRVNSLARICWNYFDAEQT